MACIKPPASSWGRKWVVHGDGIAALLRTTQTFLIGTRMQHRWSSNRPNQAVGKTKPWSPEEAVECTELDRSQASQVRARRVLTGGMDPRSQSWAERGQWQWREERSLPSPNLTQVRPGTRSREPAWWHGCEKVGGLVISAPSRPSADPTRSAESGGGGTVRAGLRSGWTEMAGASRSPLNGSGVHLVEAGSRLALFSEFCCSAARTRKEPSQDSE